MSFQCAVVHCVSKGGQLPGTRLLIWLLQKEHKLLDMLLNPQLSSIEDAIKVAKLMKTIVDQLDVLLARALKEVPEELALRILRLLAEVADSNRTLPLLTKTLREASPGLRSRAALIFSRYCHNTLFIENALNQDFHFGPGTATVYTRVAPNTTSFRAEPCTSPPPIGARARPSAHRRWLSGLNGAPADTAPAKPFWSQKLLILARATLPTGHRQRPDPPQHVAKQPPVQMSLRQ